MSVWTNIQSLQGQTLHTARQSAFDVMSVTQTAAIVKPHNQKAPLFIARREFENAVQYGQYGPKGGDVPSPPAPSSAPEPVAAYVAAMVQAALQQ
jgi:hypothetical protein